jgi:flavin reductase (DIM6/NTAB) family NADH-FMN oxidoreductase RutF
MTDHVDVFKLAMRRLTAAVSVITTGEGGQKYGMVVTAVCSLGVTPPSLLISVAHTASMHGPLMRTRKFGVNILPTDHADIIAPFSGKVKGQDRFLHGNWTMTKEGIPHLLGAQASLFCDIAQSFEYAGHTVCIGRLTHGEVAEEIRPLLYENGGLARSVALT